MKIVYILILGLAAVASGTSYTFLLTASNLWNTTLEFRPSYQVYTMSLRCDNYSYDLWSSSNYEYLQVSYEQRSSYKCSDKNFTLTLSSDYYGGDEISIAVFNASNLQLLDQFDYLTDNRYSRTVLKENVATIQNIYQSREDFQISFNYPSTVYVEVFQCPYYSNEELSVKQYDENFQYRNVSSPSHNSFYYDVFNSSGGNTYYRIKNSNGYQSAAFVKYQRVTQKELQNINDYARKYYSPSASVRSNKVIVQIPVVHTYDNEQVEFRVTIAYYGYQNREAACVYGDKNLTSQYSQNYYTNSYTFTQYYTYGEQEEVIDFPLYYTGQYTVSIAAIIKHKSSIVQTIPYDIISVYQNSFDPSNSRLVHILAPIIISVLALFGLIVGGCKFRTKLKQLREQEQQQQQQQLVAPEQNRNQNQQLYFGVQ